MDMMEARIKAGFARKQVAEKIGISAVTLARMENYMTYGRTFGAYIERLEKIAKLYGVRNPFDFMICVEAERKIKELKSKVVECSEQRRFAEIVPLLDEIRRIRRSSIDAFFDNVTVFCRKGAKRIGISFVMKEEMRYGWRDYPRANG